MVIFDALVAGQFRRSGARSLVAIAAIALGVAVWLAIRLATAHAVETLAVQTGAFGDEADFIVDAPGGTLAARLLGRVRAAAGIASAMPEIEGTIVVDARPGVDTDRVLRIEAFDLLAPLPRAFEFRRELPGTFAPAGSGPNPALLIAGGGVVVSDAFARTFGVGVGDALRARVGTERIALVVAAVLPRDTAAIDRNVGIVDIATAQALFGIAGFDRIACIALPGRETLAKISVRKLLPAGARIATANERRAEAERLLAGFAFDFIVLGCAAFGVTAVVVCDAIAVSVVRRRGDIATLRALGATRRAIARTFVWEGALLGGIGALLGVGAGTLVARAAGAVPPGIDPYAFDRAAPLVAAFLGIATTTVAAIVPARAAAAISPAVAWSRRAFAAHHVARPRRAAFRAIGCVGVGAIALVLARPGSAWLGAAAAACFVAAAGCSLPAFVAFATRALRRACARATPGAFLGLAFLEAAPVRVAASVGTLGLAIALGVVVSTFAASFHASLEAWNEAVYPGDLVVRPLEGATASARARFSHADEARVAALPGIANVVATRTLSVPLDGAFAAVTEKPGLASGATIDDALSARTGVRTGDTIAVPISGRIARVRVVDVAPGDPLGTGTIAFDAATFARVTGDASYDSLALRVTRSADVGSVRARVRGALAPRAIDVRSTRDLRAASLARFDGAANATFAVAGIALLAGAFGIAATLAALVLEFRDEIRLLRYAGLTRAQTRTMVVVQGAAIGAIGAAAGIVLGMVAAFVLVATDRASFGWTLTPVVPFATLAAIFAIGVVLAAIAGIAPGRNAARIATASALAAIFASSSIGFARATPVRASTVTDPATMQTLRVLGHLHAGDEARYDVAAIFFHAPFGPRAPGAARPASAWRARGFEAADVSFVDENARTTESGTRVERDGIGSAHAANRGLDVRVDDWTLRERRDGRSGASRIALHLAEGSSRADLVLTSVRGNVAVGADGSAWPRLAARGTLFRDGRAIAVTGSFWIDRTSAPGFGANDRGWERFVIQFDDGRALVADVVRGRDGRVTSRSGAFFARDGTVSLLGTQDIALENPLATTWRNARGVPYPSLWELFVPRFGLDLALVPDVQAQEIDSGLRGATVYLGALDVERAQPGPRDAGRGYAELTGYDGPIRPSP